MEHAASYGNNLQIACHAAPILASKNGRGGVWKMHSCGASGREDWGEGGHARQVCYAIKNHRKITEVLDPSQSDACCAELRLRLLRIIEMEFRLASVTSMQ
jgi:hypothetical protein